MGYFIDDRPQAPDLEEPKTIYVIAEKRGQNGNLKKTIAWKTIGGKHTADVMGMLNLETKESNVEIVIVSDLQVYGEYKPEKIMDKEHDFIKAVKNMLK